MNEAHLFHFTPSLMTPETLEAMFVQREPLAQRLVELIRESACTENKHHTLLIGPRGMGKTHLIALIYHRVRAIEDLRNRLRIAWMQEEEWGVESFLDLLVRIGRALQQEYPQEFPTDRFEAVYQQEPASAQRAAENLLKDFLKDRTLLLLVENLDDIFKGMGDAGQRRFRAFLQETGFTTILGTSQSLFNGVSRQTAPFFGFFRTLHLEEFTIEEAQTLLTHIARLRQDTELLAFLNTPIGRARVRAICHLAGGNPRVYVIFSEFLTRESLDDLVQPFLSTLDELTPYYQARISYLSVQQRKIVQFLCDNRAPATVKEIARRCFTTPQTASSQLKDLKEKGYVYADPLGPTGRDTYYELCEPLLRMSLEVKKSRSGPLRLLIEFLRFWYTRPELKQQLDLCKPETPVEREYLTLALQEAEQSEDPRIKACMRDLDRFMKGNEYEKLRDVSDELIALAPTAEAFAHRGMISIILGDLEGGKQDAHNSIQLDESYDFAWLVLGMSLVDIDKQAAERAIDNAVALTSKASITVENVASIYNWIGAHEKSLEFWKRAKKKKPRDGNIRFRIALCLERSNLYEEAIQALQQTVQLVPTHQEAWSKLCLLLAITGQAEEGVRVASKLLAEQPMVGEAWHIRAKALLSAGHLREAKEDFLQAIELLPNTASPYFGYAMALFASNLPEEAISTLKVAFEKQFPSEETLYFHTLSILGYLWSRSTHAKDWKAIIFTLVNLYVEQNMSRKLASAWLQTLPVLIKMIGDEGAATLNHARNWHTTWKEATEGLTEFEMQLRLMDATLRYLPVRDKRVLLELSVEERKILEDLLAEAGVEGKHNPTVPRV